jgi:hypothetical protein
MKHRHILVVMAWAALAVSGTSAVAAPHAAEQQIRAVIATTYDRPGQKVETAPIVVADSYAIADWIQGGKGGRALLRVNRGRWEIVACGGDGFKDVRVLQDAGLQIGTAKLLVMRLNQAEATLDARRVKQFGLFDAKDQSMPADHHGHPPH